MIARQQKRLLAEWKSMRLLNVTEVAARLGLTTATIRSWVYTRKIEYVKLGRSVRVSEDTIEKIIEAGTIPALDREL
jgi:excisionase family DNA binding protein